MRAYDIKFDDVSSSWCWLQIWMWLRSFLFDADVAYCLLVFAMKLIMHTTDKFEFSRMSYECSVCCLLCALLTVMCIYCGFFFILCVGRCFPWRSMRSYQSSLCIMCVLFVRYVTGVSLGCSCVSWQIVAVWIYHLSWDCCWIVARLFAHVLPVVMCVSCLFCCWVVCLLCGVLDLLLWLVVCSRSVC